VGLDPGWSTSEIETGTTFEENALLKARHYHSLTGLLTLADDSGLEVVALGCAPGVYSARYGGQNAADADRVVRLLEELRNVPDQARGARFVCSAAAVWEAGERTFTAVARGMVLMEPRGSGGFGYDPIFYYPALKKTFAELSTAEKFSVSHRGLAFRQMKSWLKESGLLDTPGTGDRMDDPTSTSANSERGAL
jgi:XTP/dITP diphosphohydrolase